MVAFALALTISAKEDQIGMTAKAARLAVTSTAVIVIFTTVVFGSGSYLVRGAACHWEHHVDVPYVWQFLKWVGDQPQRYLTSSAYKRHRQRVANKRREGSEAAYECSPPPSH